MFALFYSSFYFIKVVKSRLSCKIFHSLRLTRKKHSFLNYHYQLICVISSANVLAPYFFSLFHRFSQLKERKRKKKVVSNVGIEPGPHGGKSQTLSIWPQNLHFVHSIVGNLSSLRDVYACATGSRKSQSHSFSCIYGGAFVRCFVINRYQV